MAAETVRLEGLRGVLEVFERFPVEMAKAGGPVRAGLRKGANRLRDVAKRNVRAIIDEPNLHNLPSESTGLLLLSVQAKRSRVARGLKGEAFVIGVKRGVKYPAFKQAKKEVLTAVQIGRQLEYGTERREPMPWLRPAYETDGVAAMRESVDEMDRRAQLLVKRLERQAPKK